MKRLIQSLIIRTTAGLSLVVVLHLPLSASADIVSDSRAATGVISNYLQGVTAVLGSDILQQPIKDMIALTQDALGTQPPEAIQFLAEGTQYASIITDILSLQGDMQAAAANDATKAGSLLKVSQDIWDIFWIIASKTGLQSGDILPGGGMLTAFDAANYVIGVQFFIVSQVLNAELSVVNYGVGIITAGLDAKDHAMDILGGQTFFSDTEKAVFNDYLVGVDQGIYWPLIDMLRSDMGISNYVPKENYNVFDITANYPGFPFADPKIWTVAADGKVIVTNGQKKLQITLWTYTKESGGKSLPHVRLEFLQEGVLTNVPFATNFWNSPDGNAQNNVLYGPKCTYTTELPLPPNSTLPSEVRTVWSFPDAPDTTNLTVYRFADVQIQSPNLSGNFLTASADTNRHVSIPITLSSALAVTNLQLSLTSLNTTNDPPIVATNTQVQFIGFPAGLTNGESVTGSLDLDFSVNVLTGAYTGILQIDALNASPIMLAVQVTVAAIVTPPQPPIVDLTNGLVAYYPFNGNANDESGNGHDGTVYGATPDADRFGKPNSSYHFSGTTNWIKSDLGPSCFTNNFTISVWVKFDDFECDYPVIIAGNQPFIHCTGMGPVYGGLYGHVTIYQEYCSDPNCSSYERIGWLISGNTFQTNQWHHLCITRSGLSFTMYVDGTISAQETDNGNIPLAGSFLQFGSIPCCDNNHYLHGNLDDIRIYNRALSADEIQKLYVTEGGLNAGLVAYYPFDGNANDASGNGHDGVVMGATLTADRFGNTNSAFSFDGSSSSFISLDTNRPLTGTNTAFAISAWFLARNYSDGEIFIHRADFRDMHLTWTPYGTAYFELWDDNTGQYVQMQSAPLPTNQWIHCVGTYDGAVQCLYVNGALVAATNWTGVLNWNRSFFAEGIGGKSSDSLYRFQGKIDDVRIYNRALSADEIQQLYATEGGLNAGLVAYYPFNGNANDESGNGNNGTVFGATMIADRFGNPNSAYRFNGVGDYIDCGNPVGNNPTALTECVWLRIPEYFTSTYGFGKVIMTKRLAGGCEDWSTLGLLDRDGGALAVFGVDDCGYLNYLHGPNITTNVWHLLCGVKNGESYELYVDGIGTCSMTDSHPLDGSPYHLWLMSSAQTGYGWYEYLKGDLDDVRIYNRALSASEVWQLYTLGLPALGAICQGGNIVLSWPTNVSAFTLESATNLGPSAVWAPVSPAPVVVNDQYVVTNSFFDPCRFFRLRGP